MYFAADFPLLAIASHKWYIAGKCTLNLYFRILFFLVFVSNCLVPSIMPPCLLTQHNITLGKRGKGERGVEGYIRNVRFQFHQERA